VSLTGAGGASTFGARARLKDRAQGPAQICRVHLVNLPAPLVVSRRRHLLGALFSSLLSSPLLSSPLLSSSLSPPFLPSAAARVHSSTHRIRCCSAVQRIDCATATEQTATRNFASHDPARALWAQTEDRQRGGAPLPAAPSMLSIMTRRPVQRRGRQVPAAGLCSSDFGRQKSFDLHLRFRGCQLGQPTACGLDMSNSRRKLGACPEHL